MLMGALLVQLLPSMDSLTVYFTQKRTLKVEFPELKISLKTANSLPRKLKMLLKSKAATNLTKHLKPTLHDLIHL